MTDISETGEHGPRLSAKRSYVQRLREVGLAPLALLPGGDDQVGSLMPLASGVLLMGGDDVDPSRYGQGVEAPMGGVDPPRERLEEKVLAWADEHGLPLLAICRGVQSLNVFRGGTLWQDLAWQRPESFRHDLIRGLPPHHLAHRIRIASGSLLHRLLGRETLLVNTQHHQALRDLGRGLRAVAWAEDGIVEAVEGTEADRFLLGVQFHPEELTEVVPEMRALFQGFATACRAYRESLRARAGSP
jgi:putative glutamine amidotransferase